MFAPFACHVVRTRRLSRNLQRVTLGGPGLEGLVPGGRDQSFSLFLPHPGQEEPVLPDPGSENWFLDWYGMDPAVRGIMRSYTIAGHDPSTGEIDVDFVLHGDSGPASRWAASAQAGHRVALFGPQVADNTSVCFRPGADTDWVLLAADETALPALAGILAWLPPATRVRAWVTVPHPDDVLDLKTDAELSLSWLVAGDLAAAVRAAELPDGTPYAWIAGEAGQVKALRRHLVNDRAWDRRRITFAGYWRRGASEDRLRELPPDADV